MVPSFAITLLLSSFVVAIVLEALVLNAAHRLQIYAQPNSRSFHEDPIPGIGGIAIVVPVCGYLAYSIWFSATGSESVNGVLAGGIVLAVVGLLDDLMELGSAFRFACQLFAVALLFYFMGLDWSLPLIGVVGFILLWHINLFNFMDGIDGIAGVQVMVFCAGSLLLGIGAHTWVSELHWVLLGATLGFLAFNWYPAKIFMGDVGSLFLGLVLGALVIEIARIDPVPLVASLILLAGFLFDASYTLCVRMLTRQRFMEAHRSHLYQQLAARIGHLLTTLGFAVFGLIWLLPLAALSLNFPGLNLVWIGAAIAPLFGLAIWFRAGIAAGRPEVEQ